MSLSRTLAGIGLAAASVLVLVGCAAGTDGGTSTDGDAASSGFVTDGKLTIGTGLPAYFPWVVGDDPSTGEGFEAAVAYAVAEELGFAADDVVWVNSTFEEAIAPGPKNFDFNLQQFSITPERAEQVDFSPGYYTTTQAVVTVEGSAAAGATSVADLKGLLIGAQTGSTSFISLEEVIASTQGAQVFNTNDDAKLALQNGTIDALVVDLPTAFYITGAELDAGVIVGQLPESSAGGDEFGLVLTKDSPLTERVAAAINALRDNGTLDALAEKWLASTETAPVLK